MTTPCLETYEKSRQVEMLLLLANMSSSTCKNIRTDLIYYNLHNHCLQKHHVTSLLQFMIAVHDLQRVVHLAECAIGGAPPA